MKCAEMHKDTQEGAQCHFTFVLSANPFGTMQPAAQAAGCFCCPADGELAHRTTDNENRQEVRRTAGCMIPKGLPGPPRAASR